MFFIFLIGYIIDQEKRVSDCVHSRKNHDPHYLEFHFLHIWNISLIPLGKRN
jgi:hypothetical protein